MPTRQPRRPAVSDTTVTTGLLQGQQSGSGNTQIINLPGRPAREVPRQVRFRLPRVVAGFTARTSELDRIERGWPEQPVQPPIQVITGLAGVGKTQLAAAYTAGQVDRYDLVAWVRAVDPVTDLAGLADRLEVTEREDTPEQRADWAVSALAVWDRPWLLIFDNVDDPTALATWCPASGPGRVLITTRHRGLADFGNSLHLDVFDLPDATRFLRDRTGRDDTDGARQVAVALGRLPLALAHAAAYCRPDGGGTAFPDYLELLDALPAADLFDRNPEAFYAQTVASTWTPSITAAIQRAPLAGDTLNLAAMLHPDAIPFSLFDVLLNDENEQRWPEQTARPALSPALSAKRLRDALAALHTFSLAQVTSDHLSVHRLLHKVVRDQVTADGDTTPVRQAVWALAGAWPEDVGLPEAWPLCQLLTPHATALTDLLTTAEPPALDLATAQQLGKSLNTTTVYQLHTGSGSQALFAATRRLELCTRLLGPDHSTVLIARNNLAGCYAAAGRTTEALPMAVQVLSDRERLLGPDHPATLSARSNLASQYAVAGRTMDALPMAEQVLTDTERLLGPDHLDTLRARNNLASNYADAGRTQEALSLSEQVLTDTERLLGPNHPYTLRARNNLASNYADAGRTQEALSLSEQVLTDTERLLGPDHPDTLKVRGILADCYADAGQLDEALGQLKTCIAVSEQVLGGSHPQLAVQLHRLGRLRQRRGELSAAVDALARAVAVDTAAYGPYHATVASDLDALAEVQEQLDDHDAAGESRRRAEHMRQPSEGQS